MRCDSAIQPSHCSIFMLSVCNHFNGTAKLDVEGFKSDLRQMWQFLKVKASRCLVGARFPLQDRLAQ